jgi:hypothetical protein
MKTVIGLKTKTKFIAIITILACVLAFTACAKKDVEGGGSEPTLTPTVTATSAPTPTGFDLPEDDLSDLEPAITATPAATGTTPTPTAAPNTNNGAAQVTSTPTATNGGTQNTNAPVTTTSAPTPTPTMPPNPLSTGGTITLPFDKF